MGTAINDQIGSNPEQEGNINKKQVFIFYD
jgi:hypothetical protein